MDVLNILWKVIASVPNVIWSGVVGAVIALIGVYFVNKSNTTRLRMQLDHDSLQNERDRLAALRKEVYLLAPKEAVKAFTYLGKLASRDLANIGDDEGISGFGAVAAQIGVISDLPTVEAMGNLSNTLALELLGALHELAYVQDTRVDIRIREQRLAVVTGELQRIQAEQQSMSESGTRDAKRYEALTYWLDVRMEEMDKLLLELDELRAKHQRALFEYHKAFFDRMPEITAQSNRVMRAIRQEIGLVYELDLYESKMNQLAADLRAKVLGLMDGWASDMEADLSRPQNL